MAVLEVAVIGAGPAGIAAAIQLKRQGIVFRIWEADKVGGQVRNAFLVENYPGFPRGISGPVLVRRLKKHLEGHGIRVDPQGVLALDYGRGLFSVRTPAGAVPARRCIVATGTRPLQLPEALAGRDVQSRIFYEITPLARTARKKIAVVGAGDVAFDYALNLSRRNKVLIFNRAGRPKCLPLLQARAKARPGIVYRPDIRLESIRPTAAGLRLGLLGRAGRFRTEVACLLAAIGREPRLDFLGPTLRRSQASLLASGKLYLAGDVANSPCRQTAMAVGDGIRAALKIARDMAGEKKGVRR